MICSFESCSLDRSGRPLGSTEPLNSLDNIAACAFMALTLGEAVADKQMFNYQNEKYRRIRAREPAGEYARGFIESGACDSSLVGRRPCLRATPHFFGSPVRAAQACGRTAATPTTSAK